jgi:CHASE2 domain-containing sensor protein
MSKRITLRFDGSLEQGFRVVLEIRTTTEPVTGKIASEGPKQRSAIFTESIGTLPPAIELIQILTTWQQQYLGSIGVTRIALENIGTQLGTLAASDRCRQLAKDLQLSFNSWLAADKFQPIDQRLRETLKVTDEIEILLRTNDQRLHRLPWHLWDFIERYPQAELSIGSSPELLNQPQLPHHPVRILAILGDRQGIDIESDRRLLAALPQSDVVFLVEPSRQDLYDHLWEKSWDILFFAGHSSTDQQQGRIHLSAQESLTIDELRYGLRRAIDRGLQLAIFNSCDGLGLAYELEQLHMPHAIVMREPVSDRVALTFLQKFLSDFATGVSLYTAVRRSREYLQGLEGEFPCASWLPIICQNPAVPTSTWLALQGEISSTPTHIRQPPRLWPVLMFSLIATLLTGGLRYLGTMQTGELQAFDTLMRLRPIEKPDARLLIVTVTEADVTAQAQAGSRGSLSDASLTKLLDKIEPSQPLVIGLDIYRDYPVSKTYPALATKLQNENSSIIGVCKVSEAKTGDTGVKPPPEISLDRIGFSDVIPDPDLVVRRHLLSFTPPVGDACQTSYGLSVQLALRYLAAQGINLEFTPQEAWKLGKLTIPLLEAHQGGYQQNDSLAHQIMLNYRATPTPNDFAATVTMADVLAGKVPPAQIKDRIILIGTTAQSFHDSLLTPYNTPEGGRQLIPGVILQGQMVSQLLSATLDGRPLIRSWHLAQDVLWIWGWAIGSGCLVIWLRRPLTMALGISLEITILVGSCLVLLQMGYWVPFLPTTIAIFITVGILYLFKLNKFSTPKRLTRDE